VTAPKLTFQLANRICLGTLPIGESVWLYFNALCSDGFAAFRHYNEFVESFGNSYEVETHRQAVIEIAKSRLGQPWPMQVTGDERKLLYSSKFLAELGAKRDLENGCSVAELEKQYSDLEALWRRQLDPCHRNKVRMEVFERDEYTARWKQAISAREKEFESEAQAFARRNAEFEAFEMEDRFAVYDIAMRRHCEPLGFKHDRAKSRDEFPVFSKTLVAGWDLCWSLSDTRDFALAPKKGNLEMTLDLRGTRLKGSVNNARSGEFLIFRYQYLIPGFEVAYWMFRTPAELELAITAHMKLYSAIAPILESAIVSALQPLAASARQI